MNGVVITNNRCDPNGITGHASPSCQEPFRNQRDLTLWDNRIFIWHLPKFIEFSSFFGAKYSYLIVLMQCMLILCKILSEKSVHFSKNYSTIWKLSWTYLHRKDSKYCFSWLQVYTSVNFSRVITTKSGSSVILVINQINLFKDWIHCFQRTSIWTGKKDVKFQFSTKMNPQISVKKQISWKKEWLLKKFICVNPNNL